MTINFKYMVVTEFEGVEEKYVKGFEGWLDYHSVVDAMKTVFPKSPPSK